MIGSVIVYACLTVFIACRWNYVCVCFVVQEFMIIVGGIVYSVAYND